MLLEDVPSVILRQILNGQSSWAAIELWKCGSRNLNARLASKGITHIELIDTDVNSTSRWPRCLKEFALESLTVDRGQGPLGTTLNLQRELKQLSSSLKVLNLHCRGAPNAFFYVPPPADSEASATSIEAEDVLDDDMRPAKRAKHVETDSTQPHVELWNLDITWPKLERLDIKGEAHGQSSFGINALSMLPRTLTYYDFSYMLADGVTNDLSILPPGLQTFLLLDDSITKSGLRTLPKSITNIRIGLDEDALYELIHHPKLLPHLASFPSEFTHDELGNGLEEFIEDGVPWPKSVRELALHHVDEQSLIDLPSWLTAYASLGGECTTTLKSEHIAGLPKTLTTLCVQYVEWQDINAKDWPPVLSTIETESAISFAPQFFSSLPRSLLDLNIQTERDEDLDDEELEEQKELETSASREELLALGRDALAIDKKRWKKEKQRLLHPYFLALGGAKYVKRVEAGELFGLPLGILNDLPSKHKHLTPPHVSYVSYHARVSDSKTFHYLPPSDSIRVTVVLSGPKKGDDGATSLQPSQSALYKAPITNLEVEFKSSFFAHRSLQFLPRGLKALTVGGLLYIDNTELNDLPSKLESLSLHFQLSHPFEPWLHLLPKTLTSLTVTSAPILGSEIVNLPPHLEHLTAILTQVSLSQARQLPRALRTITIKDSDNIAAARRDGVLHEHAWKTLKTLCRPFWRIREFSEAYLESEINLSSDQWPTTTTLLPKTAEVTSIAPDTAQYDSDAEASESDDDSEENESAESDGHEDTDEGENDAIGVDFDTDKNEASEAIQDEDDEILEEIKEAPEDAASADNEGSDRESAEPSEADEALSSPCPAEVELNSEPKEDIDPRTSRRFA